LFGVHYLTLNNYLLDQKYLLVSLSPIKIHTSHAMVCITCVKVYDNQTNIG
jgi:hypothetical protein